MRPFATLCTTGNRMALFQYAHYEPLLPGASPIALRHSSPAPATWTAGTTVLFDGPGFIIRTQRLFTPVTSLHVKTPQRLDQHAQQGVWLALNAGSDHGCATEADEVARRAQLALLHQVRAADHAATMTAESLNNNALFDLFQMTYFIVTFWLVGLAFSACRRSPKPIRRPDGNRFELQPNCSQRGDRLPGADNAHPRSGRVGGGRTL